MATNKPIDYTQIHIDPKTVEPSTALRGILNATKLVTKAPARVRIESIVVGNDYISLDYTGAETADNCSITIHT